MIAVAALAAAVGVGSVAVAGAHGAGFLVYTAAVWLLMTVAAMPATTVPLLQALTAVTAAWSRQGVLTGTMVLGIHGRGRYPGRAGLTRCAQVVHRPAVHERGCWGVSGVGALIALLGTGGLGRVLTGGRAVLSAIPWPSSLQRPGAPSPRSSKR